MLLEKFRHLHNHRFVFDCARSGNNSKMTWPEHSPSHANAAGFGAKFPADQLVRLCYANALGNAGQHFDRTGVDGACISCNADCRPVRTWHGVWLEPHRGDHIAHSIDLLLRRTMGHHN
jgi:hypothetical protein